MSSARAVVFIAASLLITAAAHAHERTTSYSHWEIRGRSATVNLRLSLLDATRFPWWTSAGADAKLAQYVAHNLTLMAGKVPCSVDGQPRRMESPPERVIYEWRVTCAAEGTLTLHSDLLLDVAPTHLHFSRVSRDGTTLSERVFSDAERNWILTGNSEGTAHDEGTTFIQYVALGVGHILSGYDHLAFLLVLLLLERRTVALVKIVTGFTIGHSITLALACFGLLHPARPAVEATIALSIALVAAEDLWRMARQPRLVPWAIGAALVALALVARSRAGTLPAISLAGMAVFSFCYLQLGSDAHQPTRWRWAAAFLFGLVHGLAFAGVLIEAELPPNRLAQALMGFNLGVELGQIAAVLLVCPLAIMLARALSPRWRRLSMELTSATVLALGIFWFVLRAHG